MNSLTTSLRIGWPNVQFDPGDDDEWLIVDIFPNEPENYGWDADAPQVYMGFLQVRVYSKLYRGIVSMTDEAEKVVAHFPKGTALGPVTVSQRPWVSPKVVEDDKCFIPVTIRYRSIT
ncbi:MAG: hypothetical protein GVY36_19245 [Verrucomicrobia bacterium]|nr:hypothetical protein [Verrucomicrobiota bacterium]